MIVWLKLGALGSSGHTLSSEEKGRKGGANSAHSSYQHDKSTAIIYRNARTRSENDKLHKYDTGETAAKRRPRGQNRCGTMRGI